MRINGRHITKINVAVTTFIIVFLVILSLLLNLFFIEGYINSSRYVAIGTLLLALVTASLALFTFLSVLYGYKKEYRDRKERKLITIIDWATEILKCETKEPIQQLPIVELAKYLPQLDKARVEMIFEYHNRNPRTNLIMRYQNLDAMGKRMVLISKSLDTQYNCNLEKLVRRTSKKLEEHVKLGFEWVAGALTDDEYKEHWNLLIKSAMTLAEKAETATD